MSTRRFVLAAILVAVALGAGEAVLRSGPEPPPRELVPWEPYERLGEPPYDRPVLLEFSADWCAPCRRMQVTTFRDPRFVELLRRHDLRPVRLEYSEAKMLEFDATMNRYGAKALPAMVVIRPDGKKTSAILGVVDTETFEWELWRAMDNLRETLYRHPPDFKGSGAKDRVTLLSFDTPSLVPRRYRHDWRHDPSARFVAWAERHLDLVEDLRHPVHGAGRYWRYGIKQVPTLIVLDGEGKEIARFEGSGAVAEAPGEIARIARERGLEIPDPPAPYALGGPPRFAPRRATVTVTLD